MPYEYYNNQKKAFETPILRKYYEALVRASHQRYFTAQRFEFYLKHTALMPILTDYPINPEKYVKKFFLFVNGKKREIITYSDTEEGFKLREIHRMFSYMLREYYITSFNSYAYKKNSNIKDCLNVHLNSDTFLKTDIHHYFDSIQFEPLLERYLSITAVFQRKKGFWKKVLAVCFFDNHLPIGFVSSPVLSDLYLNDLDIKMLGEKTVCYTRYADDIIISTTGTDAENRLKSILDDLKQEITEHNLSLNYKKTYIRKLRQEGDAIHLLGLNLVRKIEGSNRVTVSDSYIRDTSIELCSLMQDKNMLEHWELQERFTHVMGKISFITMASESSALKLKKMVRIKTGCSVDMTYSKLAQLVLGDDASIHAFEHEKHVEAYVEKNKMRLIPSSGRVWEEVDSIHQGHKSTLIVHLQAICRQIEAGPLSQLSFNRLYLEVGDESCSFTNQIDSNLLRSLIKKAKTEGKIIRYSADYSYQNSATEKMVKQGNGYHSANGFRPLLMYYGATGLSYLYSREKEQWYFTKDDEGGKLKHDSQLLQKAELSEILTYSQWRGHLEIELSRPLHTKVEIKGRIDSLLTDIRARIKTGNTDSQERDGSIQESSSFTIAARTLYELVELLEEAVMLIKQANGHAKIDGWFIPVGFLETTKKTPLKYLSLSCISKKLIFKSFTTDVE